MSREEIQRVSWAHSRFSLSVAHSLRALQGAYGRQVYSKSDVQDETYANMRNQSRWSLTHLDTPVAGKGQPGCSTAGYSKGDDFGTYGPKMLSGLHGTFCQHLSSRRSFRYQLATTIQLGQMRSVSTVGSLILISDREWYTDYAKFKNTTG